MHECLNQKRQHEHHLLATRAGLEGGNHTLERRLKRTSEPECALRDGLRNDLVQPRFEVVQIDQGHDECTAELLE